MPRYVQMQSRSSYAIYPDLPQAGTIHVWYALFVECSIGTRINLNNC